MKKRYADAVRCLFDSRMRDQLPQFRRLQGEGLVSVGSRVYEWRNPNGINCYIALIIAQKKEWFTVEVAWSNDGEFPAYTLPGYLDDEAQGGKFRMRLGHFWLPEKVDFWWYPLRTFVSEDEDRARYPDAQDVTDEVRRVRPYVDEAISKIVEYAIAFFEQLPRR